MHKKKFKIFVNDIMSARFRHANKILYFSIFLCFSFIAFYILKSGFSMSTDSERYSRWADKLIDLNFNIYEFFLIDKSSHRPSLFFSLLPVLLISLSKIIFVNEWQFSFLLLNLFLVFFSLMIIVKILLIIRVRSFLISLTLPIFVISVDLLTWPKFILSDMIYSFLVLYAVYFVIKTIMYNKVNYSEFFFIIFLLITCRPSSIPVICAVTLFLIISKFEFFFKQRNIVLILSSAFFFAPLFLSAVYSFIEFNFNEIAKIDFLTSMVKDGMIIHDRPETWVEKPKNFLDIMCIYFLRLINFFNPYASTFSNLHITFNIIQAIVIFLSILTWIFHGGFSKSQNHIYFFIILLSLFVGTFHSFILIDYDWRYRFPILIPMIVLFPITLENILKYFKFKKFS
jgi:hypothetical protein